VDERLAIRIVREAIDGGINFMDNSWDYNDGASEIRMGKALLDGHRNKVFLMTKTDGRLDLKSLPNSGLALRWRVFSRGLLIHFFGATVQTIDHRFGVYCGVLRRKIPRRLN